MLDLILNIKGKNVKEIYTASNKIISNKFKNTPHDFAVSIIKFKDDSIAKICSNFSVRQTIITYLIFILKTHLYSINEIRVSSISKKTIKNQ